MTDGDISPVMADQDCDVDCNPDTHTRHCQNCDACAPLCPRLELARQRGEFDEEENED